MDPHANAHFGFDFSTGALQPNGEQNIHPLTGSHDGQQHPRLVGRSAYSALGIDHHHHAGAQNPYSVNALGQQHHHNQHSGSATPTGLNNSLYGYELSQPPYISQQQGLSHGQQQTLQSMHSRSHQESPQNSLSQLASVATAADTNSSDAAVQLEVLRETRRIRELELAIHESKRLTAEENRKQREAEVTLAQYGLLMPIQPSGAAGQASTSSESPPSDVSFVSPNPNPNPNPNPEPSTSASASTSTAPDSAPPPKAKVKANPKPSKPAPKKSNKKQAQLTEQCTASCLHCSKPLATLILRGSKDELSVPYSLHFECSTCVPVFFRTGAQSSSKKRPKQFELEDTTLPTVCAVCGRTKGQGGFVPSKLSGGTGAGEQSREGDRERLNFDVEVICVECEGKYKRCSNCGGGTGGYGKWRCKELFDENRKTCNLSHTSLQSRDMEMAVWRLPDQTANRPELFDLFDILHRSWQEHMFSKLAIPEVLEHVPGLNTYDDIKHSIIDVPGFMGRNLFLDPPRSEKHRLYCAITWAKQRARRDKSEPEWKRKEKEGEKEGDEWIAFNTRRTNELIPRNAVPSAMWYLEWSIEDRTLNISTLYLHDYNEIMERSIYSYMSMLLPMLEELEQHNKDFPDDQWLTPQHLWISVKASPYALRSRLLDFVQKQLNYTPLETYLDLHPHTASASLFTADSGNIPRAVNRRASTDGHDEISILCKWLGDPNGDEEEIEAGSGPGLGYVNGAFTVENVKRIMEVERKKVPMEKKGPGA